MKKILLLLLVSVSLYADLCVASAKNYLATLKVYNSYLEDFKISEARKQKVLLDKRMEDVKDYCKNDPSFIEIINENHVKLGKF